MPGEHSKDLVVSYTVVNALKLTISSTFQFASVFIKSLQIKQIKILMGYTTLKKTNTLLTNAMQFMSSVLWVMTKTKCRGVDAQEVKADCLKSILFLTV